MKFSAALFLLSLAGNAVFVSAIAMRPSLVPADFRDVFTFGGSARERVVARPVAKPPPALRKLWPLLATEDISALVTRLRASGFPASIIRDIVRSEINARYDPRLGALLDPDPGTPFWKISPTGFSFRSKRLEEYSQLQRERAKLLREMFDDPFFATEETTIAQRRQFGRLSRRKIDAVQRIDDDYAEMMSAIRAATNGIVLREDREKLGFLTREKRADLAAVLSPAELADYELRSSPITRLLSHQLGDFRPNETEFRALFSMQQQLNDKFPEALGATDFAQRRAAQQELNGQLKVTLGERRFGDYARETNHEFQQLKRVVQRENLPSDAAVRAFDLRNSVSQDSVRIADDPTLTSDQKRVALATLAQTTRSQILATLGPVAGPPFVNTTNNQWLNAVERGAAVTFTGAANRSFGSDNVVIAVGTSPIMRSLPHIPPPPRP